MLIAIFISLFVFVTFLLYWQFLGYPNLMALITKYTNKESKFDETHIPYISIVVPTYNEEKVISNRIQNILQQNYPKERFEIIVIDSGSSDHTTEIVNKLMAITPKLKLVQEQSRRGKASAINLAINSANGEIILVTDANASFDNNVLKLMSRHFSNEKVGAVGGRLALSNTNNRIVAASSVYWEIESLMRRGEAKLDSACLFHGEINAWRKGYVYADENCLSEDLDMAIKIRKNGLKIEYEPNAIAFEPGPTTTDEQKIQKKRTTIGTIQSYFKHLSYLVFPADWYRVLIFPSHKLLQIISPFLFIIALTSIVSLMIYQQWFFLLFYLSGYLVVCVFSFVFLNKQLLSIRLIPREMTKSNGLTKIMDLTWYVLLHEAIILIAWWDYIFKNYSVVWKKASTTRDANIIA